MSSTQCDFLTRVKKSAIRTITALIACCVVFTGFGAEISASAASVKLSKPVMIAEKKYESEATHPYNKQTNTLIVDWKNVKNAKKYEVYIKGGKYKSWTKYKTVTASKCKVTGLARTTTYKFKVRAVNGKTKGSFSSVQTLKTARMDFDKGGWEAMCRIVYHEVGQMSGSMWDKPIVYVADCVVNRYVSAKYNNSKIWAPFYKKYKNVQEIIYKSGGFMSDAGLTRDGATYKKVTSRVKTGVYGAVYGKTSLNGIANDYNVYYWSNRSYYSKDSRIAYSFKIPWGYFNIWRSYWG
ncbi:fibronectin type III domain-containing protein [Ruminococcus sp. Marseille-P6503]|uniref:fibronectin type III domain-containing protein n=1 Tax=Ruminococcus sp. Marseille-P6503 TaxID=2364796 RepID=UPI000F547CFC|nr:fibronectin type III domain-containing protein [Ruminococcus sp. Marseille-P6503]